MVAALAGTMMMAAPAHADDPTGKEILGDVGSVFGYVSKIQTVYNLLEKYVFNANAPSELDQIKALIQQSQNDILTQVDLIEADDIKSEVQTAITLFDTIDSLAPGSDALFSLLTTATEGVDDIEAQVPGLTSVAAVDQLGFALNIVGPIAVAVAAKDNQPTAQAQLLSDIITANQAVVQRLAPACGTFALPGTGLDDATAHGVGDCWAYSSGISALPSSSTEVTPANQDPNAKGFGSDPYEVTGVGNYPSTPTFTWPANPDYSVAAMQADAATSSPIAHAALEQLEAQYAPMYQPLAMTAETATNQIYVPIDTFGIDGSGGLSRGVVQPDTQGHPGVSTFSGLSDFQGMPQLRSVTAGVDSRGDVEIFALDKLGNLYHRWQATPGDDSTWTSWGQMAGGPFDSVAVARNQNGLLQLFALNAGGTFSTSYQILGGDITPTPTNNAVPAVDDWSDWITVANTGAMENGQILTHIAAVTDSSGLIEMFAVDNSGNLWHRQQNFQNETLPVLIGFWSGWTKVATPASYPRVRQIAVTTSMSGIFLVATADGDKSYEVVKQADTGNATDYTSWSAIPGSMYDIAVTKEGGGAGYVQMVGLDVQGNVYRNVVDGMAPNATPDIPGAWTAAGGPAMTPFPGGPDGAPVLAKPVVSGSSVNLSWTDESTNELGFQVNQVTPTGTLIKTVAKIATASGAGAGGTMTYTDIAPATGHCYQIVANNTNATSGIGTFSAPSDTVCAAPTITPGPGVAPLLLTPVESGNSIVVTWTDESTNETTFQVNQVTAAGAKVKTVGIVKSTTDTPLTGENLSLTDTAPGAGCYQVVASNPNSSGVSTFSAFSGVVCAS